MNPTVPLHTLAGLRLRATEDFVVRLQERAPDYRPSAAGFRRDLEEGAWYPVPAVRDTYYVHRTVDGQRLVFVVALRGSDLTLQNVTVPGPEWDRRFGSESPVAVAAS